MALHLKRLELTPLPMSQFQLLFMEELDTQLRTLLSM
jgi:hypothetical protein